MKITVRELRKVLREEYLRGVPEFVLRRATEKYVEEIGDHLKKFILMNKSESGPEQREALAAMNDVLESLEEESNQLLQDKLWAFRQNV